MRELPPEPEMREIDVSQDVIDRLVAGFERAPLRAATYDAYWQGYLACVNGDPRVPPPAYASATAVAWLYGWDGDPDVVTDWRGNKTASFPDGMPTGLPLDDYFRPHRHSLRPWRL